MKIIHCPTSPSFRPALLVVCLCLLACPSRVAGTVPEPRGSVAITTTADFLDGNDGVAQYISSCSRYISFRFDLDDRECATVGGPGGDVQSLSFLPTPMTLGDTLSTSKAGSSVRLSWGPSWSPYEVRRCNSSSGPCVPAAVTTTSGTIYDDPVLSDGASYWYDVECACTSY